MRILFQATGIESFLNWAPSMFLDGVIEKTTVLECVLAPKRRSNARTLQFRTQKAGTLLFNHFN
jgi:hypothetical protein